MDKKAEKKELSKIEKIRNKYGIRQMNFCKALKIPQKTVWNWESGRREAPDYLVDLIEEVVDVRMNIFGNIEQPANAHMKKIEDEKNQIK